jgi:hypothetical protein
MMFRRSNQAGLWAQLALNLAVIASISTAALSASADHETNPSISTGSETEVSSSNELSHKRKNDKGGNQNNNGNQNNGASEGDNGFAKDKIEALGPIPEGQRQIIAAQESGKGLHYVELSDAKVVRILPDDTKGSRHQKWVVQLANGKELLSIYNMDICDRVPLNVGDSVAMGGEYIWDRGGGLIHWLHKDPRNHRPDGYVDLNGVRYGEVTHPNR